MLTFALQLGAGINLINSMTKKKKQEHRQQQPRLQFACQRDNKLSTWGQDA